MFIFISSNYAYRKKEKILQYMRRDIIYKNKNRKIFFITIGLILIIISLLQPVIVKSEKYITKSGLDIYFIIDISASMLVEDVPINTGWRQNRFDTIFQSCLSFTTLNR